MLRTSELYSLTPGDVTFGPQLKTAIIALHQTKTSGPNTEETVLRDPCVVRALACACEGVHPCDPIYTKANRFFGDDLRWLGTLVGFSHQRFTPYSLRRGGATWHFHKFGSLALTSMEGRWKHERTAKIYIDGAAAEWASWTLTAEGLKMVKRCGKAFKRRFSSLEEKGKDAE